MEQATLQVTKIIFFNFSEAMTKSPSYVLVQELSIYGSTALCWALATFSIS
jgi:hypothetical protein